MKRAGTILQLLLFSLACYCQVCNSMTELKGFIEQEQLSKLTLSALINKYEWSEDSPTYFLYTEHHTIHFQGKEGTTSISFGIRNFVSEFNPGIAEEQLTYHPGHGENTMGIGFFFGSNPSRINTSGIEPLVSPKGFLRFAHAFDNYGTYNRHIGINNIYSRDPLDPPVDDPIGIKWIIEKKDIIEDPNIQSFDLNGNITHLKGDYAVWNIQMQIEDSLINVANFYLLGDLASQLDSEEPLSLGQSFSNSWSPNAVQSHNSNIEYTEMSVENNLGSYCITEWQIVNSRTCIPNEQGQAEEDLNLYDSSFGWIKQNNHLTSIAGNVENKEVYQELGVTFEDVDYSGNCEVNEAVTAVLDTKVSNIKVYPNPSTDFIFLDLPDMAAYTTSLYSEDGQKITTQAKDQSLDIRNLPNGIYFLEIREIKTGITSLQKILKN